MGPGDSVGGTDIYECMEIEALSGDHYRCPGQPARSFVKERGSKFYGFAAKAESPKEALALLDSIRQEYPQAGHHCFAWRCSPTHPEVRFSDDGEPNHSAGLPIFNEILSQNLWNVVAVVSRYFGGTKLGVSGLIQAYRGTAQEALNLCKPQEEYVLRHFRLEFPYAHTGLVMRLLDNFGARIEENQMAHRAVLQISIRQTAANRLTEALGQLPDLSIT